MPPRQDYGGGDLVCWPSRSRAAQPSKRNCRPLYAGALRPWGWRQEVDVVQGGEPRNLGRIGHPIDLLEEVEQLAGRRHPKQALDRLVALVEQPVHHPHRQSDELAGRGGGLLAVKNEIEAALEHVDELVLIDVNVGRHEASGWE